MTVPARLHRLTLKYIILIELRALSSTTITCWFHARILSLSQNSLNFHLLTIISKISQAQAFELSKIIYVCEEIKMTTSAFLPPNKSYKFQNKKTIFLQLKFQISNGHFDRYTAVEDVIGYDFYCCLHPSWERSFFSTRSTLVLLQSNISLIFSQCFLRMQQNIKEDFFS